MLRSPARVPRPSASTGAEDRLSGTLLKAVVGSRSASPKSQKIGSLRSLPTLRSLCVLLRYWPGTPPTCGRIAPKCLREAHLATLPSALAERCIKAGWPKQICASCEATSGCGTICEVFGTEPGVAFDPLGGAGTVSLVAEQLGLRSVMIELNPKYADIAERRITGDLACSIEKDEVAA